MKAHKAIVRAFLLVFLVSLIAGVGANAQDTPKGKAPQQPEKVYIPKEVKLVLQEGMAARQGRQDIPVSIFQHLFFPAPGSMHSVFFLKLKNADLGFVQSAQPVGDTPAPFLASLSLFLQFHRLEEGKAPQVVREVYVPTSLQEDGATYDADKEETYAVGYPLPPGRYLLAMAVSSLDLKRIGTHYFEFDLPHAGAITEELVTTPIFFVKQLEQMEAPEIQTVLHKDFFTYSILKIYPYLDNTLNVGEDFELFFIIFGAQPNEQQRFILEANYEVKKGEETAIRWQSQTYQAPLVSQPLPLEQTRLIKTETEEKSETQDLPAGKYTLVIKITDKVSGKTLTKTADFEINTNALNKVTM